MNTALWLLLFGGEVDTTIYPPQKSSLLLRAQPETTFADIGDTILLTDQSGKGNDISVYGYCPTFDGSTQYLSGNQIIGTETITDHGGSGTPSVSVGRIDVTAGTLEWFRLDDGRVYVLQSGGGINQSTAINIYNRDDILTLVGFSGIAPDTIFPSALPINSGYSLLENYLKYSNDITVTHDSSGIVVWWKSASANPVKVADGYQIDVQTTEATLWNRSSPSIFNEGEVVYLAIDMRTVDGSTGTVGVAAPIPGFVWEPGEDLIRAIDGTMKTYTVKMTIASGQTNKAIPAYINTGGNLDQIVIGNMRIYKSTLSDNTYTADRTLIELRSKIYEPKSLGTIVCIGDSLTEGRYPVKLQKLLSLSTIIDSGVGGNFTSQMLSRFTSDVLDYNPDIITILGGVNDAYQGVSASTIISNLGAMIAAGKSSGSTVIISTIMPTGSYIYWTSDIQAKIETVNSWILANSAGADITVDSYTAMLEPATVNLLPAFSDGSGLHTSADGIAVNAQLFFNSLPKTYIDYWTPENNILTSEGVCTLKVPADASLVAADTNSTWHTSGTPKNVDPADIPSNENDNIFKGPNAILFYPDPLTGDDIISAESFVG